MVVTIDFHGTQRVVTRTDGIDMPITAETRATEALEYVRHHYPELPLADGAVLITVNQEMASPDRVLRQDDTVSFLPFIGGG